MECGAFIIRTSSESTRQSVLHPGQPLKRCVRCLGRNIITAIVAFVIVLSFVAKQAYSQVSRGIVKEGLTIESKILGKPVRYTIYLPFNYEASKRFYPVVYLLHGSGDNDAAWVNLGAANLTADKGISNEIIPPMILIMPDAGTSRYVNNYDNSVRYEDFFFKEFIPSIESKYRVKVEKRFRAIAGLSMGGYGSPLRIVLSADPAKLKSVRLYLDCGDDDFRNDGNAALHVLLRRLKIHHEYRVRDGDHTWSYWRTGLGEGLKFIGDIFRAQ